MEAIRVLIVEDDVLIALDISDCLSTEDYVITDIVHSHDDALRSMEKEQPDIAILDINLEGKLDGIKLGEVITQEYNFPFIYLTAYANKSILEKAKATRPMGYLVKPFNERDLFSSIQIALYNFNLDRKPNKLSLDSINMKLFQKITVKEFDVILAILEGKTNSQISEQLFISINTVKTHVKNIYQKLDVHTRIELIKKLKSLMKS